MYFPLFGTATDWSVAPPPGESSDHGGEGHGLFSGVSGDGLDIGYQALLQGYTPENGAVLYQQPYTAADGQYRGINIFYQTDDGRRWLFAHCEEPIAVRRYSRGEPLFRVGSYLNYPHLHLQMEVEKAGDMPALFDKEATVSGEIEDLQARVKALELFREGANDTVNGLVDWQTEANKVSDKVESRLKVLEKEPHGFDLTQIVNAVLGVISERIKP